MGITFQYLHGHGKHLSLLSLRHLYKRSHATPRHLSWDGMQRGWSMEVRWPVPQSAVMSLSRHTTLCTPPKFFWFWLWT